MKCPHCDDFVPDGALSCKSCGSDASTGWGRYAEHAGLLPSEPVAPPRRSAGAQVALLAGTGLVVLITVAAVFGLAALAGAALLGVLAAAIAGVRRVRARRPGARDAELERQLLRRLHGDGGAASRLIHLELMRRPDVTREQAIRAAITRLDLDRR